MGIGRRIKEAREMNGLTQKQLAEEIGITSSSIANYENEVSHPKEEILYALLDVLKVDANFLFQDCVKLRSKRVNSEEDDEMMRRYHILDAHGREFVNSVLTLEYNRVLHTQNEDETLIDFPSAIPLRVSDQPASAGTGVYLGPDGFSEWLVQDNDLTRRAAFGVRVSGDSMEPSYHDGDILLVNFEPTAVGDIALVTMDGCGFVKQISDGELLSLNTAYAPIPMNESIRINGKVIGVLPPEWQF